MFPLPVTGAVPLDMMGRVCGVVLLLVTRGLMVLRTTRGKVSKMVGGTARMDIANIGKERGQSKKQCS